MSLRRGRRLASLSSFAVVLGFAVISATAPGCGCSPDPSGNGNGDGGRDDGGGDGDGGGGGDAGLNACGNQDPSCTVISVGPGGMPPMMFPLPTDVPAPTGVGANGVTRNPMGFIVLDSSKAAFDFLWIADDTNYNVGFVSKVSTKPFATAPLYREVARYVTVTCNSNSTGGIQGVVLSQNPPAGLCADGVNGCCARDSRLSNMSVGQRAVNVLQNRPSRTAVDFNGDVWVANRAHSGVGGLGQQSVTKIANSITDCIERNGLAGIQTSSDVDMNGIIETDCNRDNLPDGAGTVCTGGRQQEFWGLSDECILFTTNFGAPGEIGRPLALGKGAIDVSASDAWVGTYNNGTFYRIDGTTGMVKQVVAIQTKAGLAASNPYGAAIDQFGILWAPNIGPDVYYFNTNNPAEQNGMRSPFAGVAHYGLAVDGFSMVPAGGGAPQLVSQIWFADVNSAAAMRYRPVRNGTFAGLATGTWARATFTGEGSRGRGIGVDNRTPTAFAWVALDGQVNNRTTGSIGRIPTDLPDGTTNLTTFYSTGGRLGTLGAGVAIDLDIWGIQQNDRSAVHFDVDAAGNVMNAGSPDRVPLDDGHTPDPYTYSDFTGFGLRNFTNPRGTYSWIQQGCPTSRTRWKKIVWDADTPMGTAIKVRARSADDVAGLSGAPFTGGYTISPADLSMAPGPLMPNPARFMQVEFELTSTDRALTPALKSFQIVFECVSDIG